MSDHEPRWVHDCPVCGVTLTGDQGEQCAEHTPADELARKQRVVADIGAFLRKPAKPPRRWRR
jgi:hypothetical protein